MQMLERRCDNQITSLEIMAALMALSTFAPLIFDRSVVLFSDNKGAEGSVRRGSARVWDQCKMVHEIWTLAFQLKLHLWIERVPSEQNLADLPSRCEYGIVQALGAHWMRPRLFQLFMSEFDEGTQSCP